MKSLGKEFYLCIADFNFRIFTDRENIELTLPNSHFPYLINKTEIVDTNIQINLGIPVKYLQEPKMMFKAPQTLNIFRKNDDLETFWAIYKVNGQYAIFVANEEKSIYPYVVAVFDFPCKNWQIFIKEENQTSTKKIIQPFLFPLLPLILYYVATFNQAIMIHSSGVFDGENAYLFSGVSGIGKSTMANLWVKTGAKLINDDRLIVRQKEDGIFMYNTPMFYEDKPKKAKLDGIFLLKQSLTNEIKPLLGVIGISKWMAFCIQHDYEELLINNLLTTLANFSKELPIYHLGFLPNTNVVNFLKKGEYCYRKK